MIQTLEAIALGLFIYLVLPLRSWCTWTGRISRCIQLVETDVLYKLQGMLKLGFCFSWKTHDSIGTD